MVRYLKTRTKQQKSRTKRRKSRSLKKRRTKQRKSRSLKKKQKRKTSKKKIYRGGVLYPAYTSPMDKAEVREEERAEMLDKARREDAEEKRQKQPEIQAEIAAKKEIIKQMVPLMNELDGNGHWSPAELDRIKIKPNASLAKRLIFYRKLHAISENLTRLSYNIEGMEETTAILKSLKKNLAELGFDSDTKKMNVEQLKAIVFHQTWDTIKSDEEAETMNIVKAQLALKKDADAGNGN